MRIDGIALKKFRGASEPIPLRFEAGKPLVLIFGENGSGKTTIVDALDFVCNQRYGSLEDRSSTVPKKHMASIGSGASELEVTLEAGGQQWTGHLESSGPRTSGPSNRPPLAVLRRSQVLRIINEQPKRRYEALGDLLGLPGIRRSEESLREAARDRESRFDEAARAKQQADEGLEKLWEAEGRPSPSAVDWGRQRAAESSASLTSSLAGKDTLLSLFERSETAFGELATTRKKHEDALAIVDAQRELEEERAARVGSASLAGLLEDAQLLLSGHEDPAECPLCESTDRVKDLAKRVEVRLSDLKHLIDARKRALNAQTDAERARGAFDRATTTFTNTVRELGQQTQADSGSLGVGGGVDWSAFSSLLGPVHEPVLPGAVEQAEQLWAAMKEYRPELKTGRDADQKALNQLTAIKQHIATVGEKTAVAKDLEAVSKGLRQLLDVVESQRKSYVDGLLADVSTRAQAMYARVHPGEDLGSVRFFLKPSVMGSLECDGMFEGISGVPPQAYYSDSHLDTLGICVFLALAQTAAEGKIVVVLDDVLTSVDAPHADRVMRMLQEELPSFDQIIVTTHYRPWRERFRFRGASLVQLIDLGPWSLARGVWPVRTKMKVDELKELLGVSPLDRQAVASKAGVFLEELLRMICLKYRCKVPLLLEPKHTLGELASAITSRLSKVLRSEATSAGPDPLPAIELQPLIDGATQWGWVRNEVGAHFSDPGLDVPDADVKAFAEASLKLAEHLVCDGCGESPARNRSGSYWECRCGNLRLHPLAAPGEPTPTADD